MSDDRAAIEALLYAYAERLDGGDFAGVGALFAHGRITAAGTPGATAGRDAVCALYTGTVRLYPDGTPRTRHVTSNVVIDVDADVARARSYFTVLQQVDDFPLQPIVAGRYHDTFARADGGWRFAERHMLLDLVGDVSRHLLVALPPTRGR